MPRKPATTKKIPFFTDQNVPDSVGDYVVKAGHTVVRLRDEMPTNTKDPVVAVACSTAGHVLITHDSDFRATAGRLQITQRQYREGLHRIRPRDRRADRACPRRTAARSARSVGARA
ncbi:MAG: DUF5615 family PIN-like protein [Gammaproteobacteria bacterium]|nr:DUF5615 family PIN-like protein [Gammaproteobacteria bacterium]